MIIYISGKITGTDDYMERFAEASKKLKKDGNAVINPAVLNAKLPDDTAWETYMKNCIKWLCDANAIYMLKGWKESKGAKLEHDIAVALGLIIFEEEGER